MAEFVQTMKDWRRMCNACQTEKDIRGVCGCFPAGNYEICAMKSIDKEADLACDNLYFERLEKMITAWAAEHPEPVYPSWGEWLAEQGIVKLVNSERYDEDYQKVLVLLDSVENPIPADIAKKLGIEPKEGA